MSTTITVDELKVDIKRLAGPGRADRHSPLHAVKEESAIPLFAFTWWRRRGRLIADFAPHLKKGLIGGTVAGTAYAIAIWAMSQGPMAHVVALRETSVIMAAIIGALVLKEPFGPRRIAAAAVVALGAVLLQVG